MKHYWADDEGFDLLIKAITENYCVFFTGAGISGQMTSYFDPTKKLPDWKELINQLKKKFSSKLGIDEIKDIEFILNDKFATGSQLIEAASIIEKRVGDKTAFDKEVINLTKPSPGQKTKAHEKITELQPRGIVTFNYDSGHENTFTNPNYRPPIMVPDDKVDMLDLLQFRFNKPFLFKAHGSVDVRSSVVLTYNDYREIMHLNPEYSAFMQYLITNFNLVFYGFGLSDLDFDIFIHETVAKFGSPIHKHVIIKVRKDEELSKDILHRRRYGIYPLYIKQWEDFCPLLDDAVVNINKELMITVNKSLKGNHDERDLAHAFLSALSPPGKRVVSNYLKLKSKSYESSPTDDALMFEYSELCYTLGIIDAELNKNFLIDVVNGGINHQPVGRALTMLRSVLDLNDLPLIEKWIKQYAIALPGDTVNRILNYGEHYHIYVQAKYACL